MELNEIIDDIQRKTKLSAESRNMLHACRPGHPLGKGMRKDEKVMNVHSALQGRASSYDIDRLINAINKF